MHIFGVLVFIVFLWVVALLLQYVTGWSGWNWFYFLCAVAGFGVYQGWEEIRRR